MRKRMAVTGAIAAVLVAGFMAIPGGVAGAATSNVWVSATAPVTGAPGSSCTKPGYSTVSSAVAAAPVGATIHICAGTYTEQVVITQSVSLTAVGSVTLKLPAAPVDATTTCDAAIAANGYSPNQDEVSICGAGNVNMTGINVSAYWPPNTCNDGLYGIFVGGGSNLVGTNLAVDGAGAPLGDPDVGCQGGVGIQVGTARSAVPEAASAALKNTTVIGYQKNGITATGAGTVLTINKATVTGRGPVPTGENGFEVAYGAKGTISNATVSNNQCNLAPPNCGPDALNAYQATGVLFYGAAPGSTLSKSSVSGNDIGVYYGSAAATEPTSPEVSLNTDTISANRYIGVQFDQGKATLTNSSISGPGNVGIQVIQYINNNYLGTQTYAPAESAAKDTISGEGIGVQVYSDNDLGDFAGTFTISHSNYLHANSLAQQDNSANLFIAGVKNT